MKHSEKHCKKCFSLVKVYNGHKILFVSAVHFSSERCHSLTNESRTVNLSEGVIDVSGILFDLLHLIVFLSIDVD